VTFHSANGSLHLAMNISGTLAMYLPVDVMHSIRIYKSIARRWKDHLDTTLFFRCGWSRLRVLDHHWLSVPCSYIEIRVSETIYWDDFGCIIVLRVASRH